MSFRPTPFGLFATHYKGYWEQHSEGPLQVNTIVDNELLLLPDFRWLSTLSDTIRPSDIPLLIYYLNETIYASGTEFRFYFKAPLPSSEPAEVLSVEATVFMKKLFSFFKNCRTLHEILTFLEAFTDEPFALLGSLVEQQLLFTALRPNITGVFFGDRLMSYQDRQPLLKQLPQMTYQPLAKISGDAVRRSFKLSASNGYLKHPCYAITRSPKAVRLSTDLQPSLLMGLTALKRLSATPAIPGLDMFLTAFEKRYEQQAIPLMVALDPEYGIGYQALITQDNNREILDGLDFEQSQSPPVLKWTPVHQLFINKIATGASTIELSYQDFLSLPDTKADLPPALQVVFQKTANKVIIHEAGGANGIYLLARFTIQNPEIAKQCIDIARHEQLINPDVLFADVSFIPDEHAANVSVRESFYDYEIPILTHSVRDDRQIIKLNDLYVKIYEGKIILLSKSLNKRIIPRFNSAYNFSRSNNPIVRFLGDLQFQGVVASLTFNFSQVLPGLKFYPRVTYQDAVLSEAAWHINNNDKDQFKKTPGNLKAHLKALAIPRHFVVVEHDHRLVFDQQNDLDMQLFSNICNGKKDIVLKEFFHPEDTNDVLNADGDAVVNQFVCTVLNNVTTYDAPKTLFTNFEDDASQRSFKPGEKWCFIKLFGHLRSLDDFLAFGLTPILNKLNKKQIAASWFFIRYNSPEDHLRIRILTSRVDAVLEEFNAALRRKQFNGRFPRLSVDTYNREKERYLLMENAEDVFKHSSILVVKYFNLQNSGKQSTPELSFSVFCCLIYVNSWKLNEHDQVKYLESLANYYLEENGSTKNIKRQLDTKFRTERSSIEQFLNGDIGKLKAEVDMLQKAIALYFEKLSTLNSYKPLEHICSDLLHMHFNRLFSDDQRKKEGVVYYLTAKYVASNLARKKKGI